MQGSESFCGYSQRYKVYLKYIEEKGRQYSKKDEQTINLISKVFSRLLLMNKLALEKMTHL